MLKRRIILRLSFFFIFAVFILQFKPFQAQGQEQSKEAEMLFVAHKAMEDGFYEVSLDLLDRFLKTYPHSPKAAEAKLIIGECYFHLDKYLEALDKFEALLNDPDARDIQDAVLYWIAEVHFKGNNFPKAASYYRKIIELYPKSTYLLAAYYSLGWCLFQEQEYSEALTFFKAAEEKFDSEPLAKESSFKIIECLYNLKDYAALKERLKNYLKTYTKDESKQQLLYFYIAESDYYLNNFNDAIEEYKKVISLMGNQKLAQLSKLGLGWSYLKTKEYEKAENTFKQINEEGLESHSKDILLLGMSILMTEQARLNEANRIYDKLIGSTSDDTVLMQAYMGKAETLYNMAEYAKAIEVYRKALSNQSLKTGSELSDKMHYGLAWSFLKEGQFKEAIEEFQKIAKYSDDKIVKVSALCQIGDTYQDSGDYAKAIETYDKIIKDYPDNLYSDYVQYQLGITLLKSSKYDAAISAFQTLSRNFPHSKLLDDTNYALGLSYFQRENYNASYEIFKKFIDQYKDSSFRPQAMYLLATSLYNLSKYSQAIDVYKDIIKFYNQDKELVQKSEYEIADCYYQMGNEKEAMSRFKALRTRYPSSSLTPEIIWWLGEYYYRHDDPQLAGRYFNSLIQDFPKSSLVPNAYYALGSIYGEEGKLDEAIENFKKVISLSKNELAAQASIVIGDIYSKQKKYSEAIKFYKEVVDSFANLADLVYPKIADVYLEIGEYKEAIDFYKKSLDLVPINQMDSIQFKIGQAYQSEGNFEAAIENYLKVTYLFSENNQLAVKALLRVANIYESKDNFKEAINIYKRIAGMDVEESKYAKERIDWIRTHIKQGG